MWDRTTYPLNSACANACKPQYADREKANNYPIVENYTVAILKISGSCQIFQESFLLTNHRDTSKEIISLAVGCFEKLEAKYLLQAHWVPSRLSRKHISAPQGTSTKNRRYNFARLSPMYSCTPLHIIKCQIAVNELLIILTPSSAKPVCRENKS